VPPPPAVPRIANMPRDMAEVQEGFSAAYEADPDAAATEYRDLITSGAIGDGPNIFNTDDAKLLNPTYRASLENRAKFNVAVHNTANAIAKRAFLQHLDKVVAKMPEENRVVLVTAGGVAAGKGFAVSNNPDVKPIKDTAAAIWDSAGEQNSTELPWLADECAKRGIKMKVAYVNSDPTIMWANPKFGAVQRAKGKGRMVDATLFAESYELGAKNFAKFVEQKHAHVESMVIDATDSFKIKPTVPENGLKINATELEKFALDTIDKADVPEHIKAAGKIGQQLWKPQP